MLCVKIPICFRFILDRRPACGHGYKQADINNAFDGFNLYKFTESMALIKCELGSNLKNKALMLPTNRTPVGLLVCHGHFVWKLLNWLN